MMHVRKERIISEVYLLIDKRDLHENNSGMNAKKDVCLQRN